MDGRIFDVAPGNARNETYEKVLISQLGNAPMFPVLSGVVITKSDSRFVATKRGGRYVFNFTIRDSPRDTINASCWGDEVQIKAIKETFAIGDVVNIKNPQVVAKQSDSKNERYRPNTTSSFELLVSTQYSEIMVCYGPEEAGYKHFIHCPINLDHDCYSIADIVCSRQDMDGASVNFLVAIKSMSEIQDLKTKEGRPLKKLDLEVFDQSHPSFPIIIWDAEIANFIKNNFAPRKLVLISDIRVNFSRFIDGMMGTAVSSTVFTPDPEVPNARSLHQYAARASIEEKPSTSRGELQTYLIEDLHFMTTTADCSMSGDVVGIVYAYISSFDIDGSARVISQRCPECKQLVKRNNESCINGNCEVGSGMKIIPAEEVFDMMIRLTDHTGSVERCYAYGPVMEGLLKCSVAEFQALTPLQRTMLKWQVLFEVFKVEFRIPRVSAAFQNPVIRITSCTPAASEDNERAQ